MQPYHHENLRGALVEEGIRMVNEAGFESLSLRKLAGRLGVSHAAPYRHFADKEALMAAMQQHVERGLVQVLKKAVADAPNVADPMIEFGRAYVVFFAQNPAYYAFFTRQEGIRVVFSQSGVQSSTYAPFDLFVKQAREHLGQLGVPQAQQMAAMAGMWATVHGLAGMATMPGVQFDGDWGELTEKVLMGVHPDEG